MSLQKFRQTSKFLNVLILIAALLCIGAPSANAQSLNLSGTVTLDGVPLEGVLMDSPQLGQFTTLSDGSYSYLAGFGTSYDVTPTLAGYTFIPPTVSGVLINNTTEDFVAVANVYILSGTVSDDGAPIEDVLVDGGVLGITTTDVDGKFAFPVRYGDAYQLILSKPGYVFSGAHSGTVFSDTEIPFEADQVNLYYLQGYVVADGAGVSGVLVDGGVLGTQTTDEYGYFTFGYLNQDMDYALAFSASGYSFPGGVVTGTLSEDVFLEIEAVRSQFSISGKVLLNGAALEGVEIDGGELGTVLTDSNGGYMFSAAEFGAKYTIAANLLGYQIDPPFREVTINGDSTADFTATQPTHTITIHTDLNGKDLDDIKVDGGSLGEGRTNRNGQYQIEAVPFGTIYAIKVSSKDYEFDPDSASGVVDGDIDLYFSVEANLVFGDAIELISRASSSVAGNADSSAIVSGSVAMSADDRYVAFSSAATNLVSLDTNTALDAFVRDRENGTTSRISVNAVGQGGNAASATPLNRGRAITISADGNRIVFHSDATNLIALDLNRSSDIFLFDRAVSKLQVVSTSSSGVIGNSASYVPFINSNGDAVAFESVATNLIVVDRNSSSDIFLRNLTANTTQCISVNTAGAVGNSGSYAPALNADGTIVVFESDASDLVASDTNAARDVFLRNSITSKTELISVGVNGAAADGASSSAVVSADGSIVAFKSSATNLVSADTNGVADVFVRDRNSGVTTRVSVSAAGTQGNLESGIGQISISQDGRYVAFTSSASNLVSGDTNALSDVFVYDREINEVVRASETITEGALNGGSGDASVGVDGLTISFASSANNLVDDDADGTSDVFYRVTPLFPEELSNGEKIKNPPAVIAGKRRVTIVMQEFTRPSGRQDVNADAVTPKGSGVYYNVVLKNNLGKTISDRTGKRNRVTLGGLKPGSYSATYTAKVVNNGSVVSSTAKSPKQKFTVQKY